MLSRGLLSSSESLGRVFDWLVVILSCAVRNSFSSKTSRVICPGTQARFLTIFFTSPPARLTFVTEDIARIGSGRVS